MEQASQNKRQHVIQRFVPLNCIEDLLQALVDFVAPLHGFDLRYRMSSKIFQDGDIVFIESVEVC